MASQQQIPTRPRRLSSNWSFPEISRSSTSSSLSTDVSSIDSERPLSSIVPNSPSKDWRSEQAWDPSDGSDSYDQPTRHACSLTRVVSCPSRIRRAPKSPQLHQGAFVPQFLGAGPNHLAEDLSPEPNTLRPPHQEPSQGLLVDPLESLTIGGRDSSDQQKITVVQAANPFDTLYPPTACRPVSSTTESTPSRKRSTSERGSLGYGSQGSKGKRRSSSIKLTQGQDENGENVEDSSQKPPSKSSSAKLRSSGRLPFACLFHKLWPESFPRCNNLDLFTMVTFKQHIKRRHSKDSDMKGREGEYILSRDQMDQIFKVTRGAHISDIEKWNRSWKVAFPEERTPFSVFANDRADTLVHHLLSNAPEGITQRLIATGSFEPHQFAAIKQTVSEGLEDVLRDGSVFLASVGIADLPSGDTSITGAGNMSLAAGGNEAFATGSWDLMSTSFTSAATDIMDHCRVPVVKPEASDFAADDTLSQVGTTFETAAAESTKQSQPSAGKSHGGEDEGCRAPSNRSSQVFEPSHFSMPSMGTVNLLGCQEHPEDEVTARGSAQEELMTRYVNERSGTVYDRVLRRRDYENNEMADLE